MIECHEAHDFENTNDTKKCRYVRTIHTIFMIYMVWTNTLLPKHEQNTFFFFFLLLLVPRRVIRELENSFFLSRKRLTSTRNEIRIILVTHCNFKCTRNRHRSWFIRDCRNNRAFDDVWFAPCVPTMSVSGENHDSPSQMGEFQTNQVGNTPKKIRIRDK